MREAKTMSNLKMSSSLIQAMAAAFLALTVPVVGSAASKGPDAGGYTATDQTVFSYLDISGPGGGSALLAGTDDGTAYLTLPFTFQFYGTSYSAICVSSNGAMYFTPDAATCGAIADFANVDLSSATTPSDYPAILPFWTDLNFATPGSGSIFYAGFGTPGNRRFVIQWANAYAATSTSPVNFQVVLAEGTNSITFQYQTVALGGGDPANNGGSSTVGIHNTGGLASNNQIEWSFNVPVLSNGYALVFQTSTAPGAPVLVSPANNATNVSSPVTLMWNPSNGATSYDVHFGTTNPPALATNTGGTSFNPSSLAQGTTYYWQIVAKSAQGSTPSAVNNFTTMSPPPPGGQSSVISWSNPAPIPYGTALSATQLNATANVAGFFNYNPPAGTILNAGMQTLTVNFTPSTPGYSAASASVTIVVNPSPQTINFAPIPNHTTDDSLFNVSATASSGLPVVFSIVSGPATITQNTVNITGPGTVVVEADQAGNGNIGPAAPVQQTFQVLLGSVKVGSILNAASYANLPLASDGYAVVFGTAFATQPATAGAPPLPTSLGGVTMTITDSAGTTLPAFLYYVSFTQINFVVPEGLAAGPATVTITNSSGKTSTYSINIAPVSPALFTSDASGKGPAAAYYIVVPPNNGPTQVIAASSCAGTPVVCTPTPVDLGPDGTQVFVSLYGTGIRAAGTSGVTVTAGTVPLQVSFAGAQPTYPGLDQINALIDRSLAGKGQVTLQVMVGGVPANSVTISVK